MLAGAASINAVALSMGERLLSTIRRNAFLAFPLPTKHLWDSTKEAIRAFSARASRRGKRWETPSSAPRSEALSVDGSTANMPHKHIPKHARRTGGRADPICTNVSSGEQIVAPFDKRRTEPSGKPFRNECTMIPRRVRRSSGSFTAKCSLPPKNPSDS